MKIIISVTDRWQKFTDVKLTENVLSELAEYCDEFLVHGVDVEGKSGGMEEELVETLSKFTDIPITYAGGIGSKEQIESLLKFHRAIWISQLAVHLICLVEVKL